MTRNSAAEKLQQFSRDQTALLKLLLEEKSRRLQAIKPSARGFNDFRAPTSWAQQSLWFIDQLEGASRAYHISARVRLRGALDRKVLKEALDTIVRRHEALRTVFVSTDGEPQQEIAVDGRFSLRSIDMCDTAEREWIDKVRLHHLEELHGKFDLRQGPLIRGRLLRLAAEEHVLLVTMHHIISDGWSVGLFFQEFAKLYTAFAAGQADPLAPLPIQYADYAQWQQQWLQADTLEKQLSYWQSHLQGAAQLELPTDRPRPPTQSYNGKNLEVVVDAPLTAQLREFAQRHDMTLFMVLYGAWAILLSRLTGQDDIVIGTPVANRQRPELEGLIGYFVNTVVLRTVVHGDLSVAQFLEQIKQVTLGAYSHQDVPFEQVVERIQPQRSLSRNPLFQVMLALQSAPKPEMQVAGLSVTPEDGVDEPAMFDLLLSLEERGVSLAGVVNFATDLFDTTTIERWVACFKVLLKDMSEETRSRVADLVILPPSERTQVVESFNATQWSYPQEKLIHELFEEQAQRTPEAQAVSYDGQSLSYAELDAKANQLARYLQGKGVGADRLVGICVERSLAMVVGLLGILKAGGAYVPLDPSYPTERLEHMLKDAAPSVVLTQEKLQSVLPSTQAERITLDSQCSEIAQQSPTALNAAERAQRPEHLVYVIYTSGSTGQPKGTGMSHGSMVNLIEWHRRSFPDRAGTRVLQFAALSFDVAFQETFTTLCTGGTLVLLDEWLRRDARALLEFLKQQGIERLFIPPMMLQSLAECSKVTHEVPEGLRDVITAGEQLRITNEIAQLFEQMPGCRLHNHYGPTETHVVTALTLTGSASQWPALPSIGRPISNTQIYILDSELQPVALGVPGEIYIAGVGVARGYQGRAQLTQQRFLSDPFKPQQSGRMYKTGDVGRWRADGTIEYLGRNDHQVKIRGFRIELGEIETQLTKQEKVKEVAVIAREDAPGEKRLVAYVTQHEGSDLSVEALRGQLTGVLPEYMVPSAFVLLERLPLTPSGKLDRRALPAPELTAYVSRSYEPAEGEVEQTLAQIWQELLHVERVGRQDNFFELGGHSLHGMKLITRVEEYLGVRLPVITTFRYPTIEKMATVVDSLRAFDEGVI